METITLTIKSITSTNTKKDGTPLVGKFGPYFLVRADTQEEGNVSWFSKTAHTHKAGDQIIGTLEVSTSEKNGQTYTNKNFSFPKKDAGVDLETFNKLSSRVMKLELSLERMVAEIKSELMLEMTGKFNSEADYKKITAPHPQFADIPEPIPSEAYNDEPPF